MIEAAGRSTYISLVRSSYMASNEKSFSCSVEHDIGVLIMQVALLVSKGIEVYRNRLMIKRTKWLHAVKVDHEE